MIKPYFETKLGKLYSGHILPIIKSFPDNFVDVIVTSPPYWGLRDYGKETKTIWGGRIDCRHDFTFKVTKHDNLRFRVGVNTTIGNFKNPDIYSNNKVKAGFCSKCSAWYGQLGLEPTLDLYLTHLWQVTDELCRVLKPTGVMFWNHGDSYGGTKTGNTNASTGAIGKPRYSGENTMTFTKQAKGYEKCMLLQNYRFILGITDIDYRILVEWRALGKPKGKLEGMFKYSRIQQILRNQIIWHKLNHMPSSVKDRFTNSYEPTFMLVKNNKPQYYYNVKTSLMADRKPKKLKEGIDWGWEHVGELFNVRVRDAETDRFMEKATEREKKHYATPKLKKVSYWKSLIYWFDLSAVRRPLKQVTLERYGRGFGSPTNKYINQEPAKISGAKIDLRPKELKGLAKKEARELLGQPIRDDERAAKAKKQGMHTFYGHSKRGEPLNNPMGKNPGDLWGIPTQPFPEAHFATFPEKLIKPMIEVACPRWICKKCGKARVRITEPAKEYAKLLGSWTEDTDKSKELRNKIGFQAHTKKVATVAQYQTIGWTDCGCNAGWQPGIVLDPFSGAGTTGLRCEKMNRQWIGIDIGREYCEIAKRRISREAGQLKLDI